MADPSWSDACDTLATIPFYPRKRHQKAALIRHKSDFGHREHQVSLPAKDMQASGSSQIFDLLWEGHRQQFFCHRTWHPFVGKLFPFVGSPWQALPSQEIQEGSRPICTKGSIAVGRCKQNGENQMLWLRDPLSKNLIPWQLNVTLRGESKWNETWPTRDFNGRREWVRLVCYSQLILSASSEEDSSWSSFYFLPQTHLRLFFQTLAPDLGCITQK